MGKKRGTQGKKSTPTSKKASVKKKKKKPAARRSSTTAKRSRSRTAAQGTAASSVKRRRTKRSGKKAVKFIKICSECGSIDIVENKDNPLTPRMGLPTVYTCRKCRHTSHIFPEVDVNEIAYFRKHIIDDIRLNIIDDSEKVDLSYGRFEIAILWKMTGPAIFLVGNIMLLMTKEHMIPIIIPLFLILLGGFMIYITYLGGKR